MNCPNCGARVFIREADGALLQRRWNDNYVDTGDGSVDGSPAFWDEPHRCPTLNPAERWWRALSKTERAAHIESVWQLEGCPLPRTRKRRVA